MEEQNQVPENEIEQVPEKKKGHTALVVTIICIVVFVVIAGVGGYFVNEVISKKYYNKKDQTEEKEKKKQEEKKQEEEKQEETPAIIKEDYENCKDVTLCQPIEGVSQDVSDRINQFINLFDKDADDIKNEDLDNNQVLVLSTRVRKHPEKITKSEMEETVKKYFGSYPVKHKTIHLNSISYNNTNERQIISFDVYHYNKETETYDDILESHHGYTKVVSLDRLVKSEVKGNQVKLDIKRAYHIAGDITVYSTLYKDPECKDKVIMGPEYCMDSNPDVECIESGFDYFQDHYKDFHTVTYTFEIVDDYPVFVSIKNKK